MRKLGLTDVRRVSLPGVPGDTVLAVNDRLRAGFRS